MMTLDDALCKGLITSYSQSVLPKNKSKYRFRVLLAIQYHIHKNFVKRYTGDGQTYISESHPYMSTRDFIGRSSISLEQALDNLWKRIEVKVRRQYNRYHNIKKKYEAII